MAAKVRTVPIADLILDEGNANQGTARGRSMLEQSLRDNGYGRSVVVDKHNRVIAGNKTVEAARSAGAKHLAVVEVGGDTLVAVQRTDLDLARDKKAKRLALADNRVGEVDLAWNTDALKKLGLDLKAFWNDQELARILGADTEEDAPIAEEAMALAGKWNTALGQLWEAGRHRICCGDARHIGYVNFLFADGQPFAQCVNTDPPYGVSYESAATGAIAGDQARDDQLAQDLVAFLKNAKVFTRNDAAWYIWHATATRRDFEHAMDRAGLVERQYITWVKDTFVLGHADYHWQTEPCFYAAFGSCAPAFYGPRDQSTAWRIGWQLGAATRVVSLADGVRISNGEGVEIFLTPKSPKSKKLRLLRLAAAEQLQLTTDSGAGDTWTVSHDRGTNLHPTQKPVALAARAIANSTVVGQVVFDPFLGSGFTAIAAEQLGRRCFGLDIDPKFVAVVLERLSRLGLKPKLVATLASEQAKGTGDVKPERPSRKSYGAAVPARAKRKP